MASIRCRYTIILFFLQKKDISKVYFDKFTVPIIKRQYQCVDSQLLVHWTQNQKKLRNDIEDDRY